MAVLVLGVGLLLAPLVVLVRDLERIVRIALRLGFYASPVIFAVADVPEPWDAAFAFNPLAGHLRALSCGLLPRCRELGPCRAVRCRLLGLLVLGWSVFARLERTVLKEI